MNSLTVLPICYFDAFYHQRNDLHAWSTFHREHSRKFRPFYQWILPIQAVVINIIGWHGEWKICKNLAFLLRIRICFREICFGCKTDAIASSIAVRLTLLLPIPSSPPFSNVIHWLMSTNIRCEFWDRAENQQNNLLLFNYSNPSALLIWFNHNGVLYYIVTVSLWLL